jgi:hypothetical protein
MKMKVVNRIAFLMLCVGLYLTSAMAQETTWDTQDSTPNFPRMAPHNSAKRPRMNPNVLIPRQNSGFAPAPQGQFPCFPQPCKTTYSEPSAYVGYLYRSHGATFQTRFDGPATAGQVSLTRNDFDLQGIWLEFALPMTIAQNMSFIVSGAHLFSLQPTSTQSYTIYNSPTAARQWNPDVQWWEVNAAGAYQFAPFLSGIAGFRWTSLITNFNDARNQVGFVASNADSASLNTNSYIPYTGVLVEGKPDCRSSIKAAVYGSPVLPASLTYNESLDLTNQPTTIYATTLSSTGYFFEALTEYSMQRDSWLMGSFVRFTTLRMERTVGANVGGVNMPIDIIFDRSDWIFGGKLGYVF